LQLVQQQQVLVLARQQLVLAQGLELELEQAQAQVQELAQQQLAQVQQQQVLVLVQHQRPQQRRSLFQLARCHLLQLEFLSAFLRLAMEPRCQPCRSKLQRAAHRPQWCLQLF
jgi:hypothetical protein